MTVNATDWCKKNRVTPLDLEEIAANAGVGFSTEKGLPAQLESLRGLGWTEEKIVNAIQRHIGAMIFMDIFG